jgi:hypothetical protein
VPSMSVAPVNAWTLPVCAPAILASKNNVAMVLMWRRQSGFESSANVALAK